MINRYVALDIETTGLNPAVDRIIEVGMAICIPVPDIPFR